ncbi:Pleckstrin domain [Trinorchestia longiramus]|nr:Pleckstrin domain [Trinorchestia longiramus]
MDVEEQKEFILKNLGEAVKKVYGEWCGRQKRSVGSECVSSVVSGVDSALAHGLRRPTQGYWPLLTPLLDHDTHTLLLQYPCPKTRGWQWVLRCLSRGELESLISVVLTHAHLLPPLYCTHALLRDPSAQLVLPTLLAGLEHVRLNKATEDELERAEEVDSEASNAASQKEGSSALRSLRSLRSSLLPSRSSKPRSSSESKPEGSAVTVGNSEQQLAPQFELNVPQAQFPSLEAGSSSGTSCFPPPRSASCVTEPPYPSLVLSLDQLHEPPIDVCREATEDLNDQMFEADDESEVTVEVHHFGKRKKSDRRRSSSKTTDEGQSSCGHRLSASAKKDEAEAQEMSLEEELMAATQGDFVENRPPFNLSSDPDLIVGIVGDDKLVKVLPDPAAKHVDGFHIQDCDEYSTDELDVEIVEAFPCVQPSTTGDTVEVPATPHDDKQSTAQTSSPECRNGHHPHLAAHNARTPENSGKKTEKSAPGSGGSAKIKKDKESSKWSARSSQQQLAEAKLLLKNLTKTGVIEVTPELNKLMDSLEQREAMLSERSPPEGQEDPVGLNSTSSLKKPAKNHVKKASNSDRDAKESNDGVIKNASEEETANKENRLDGYVSTSSGSMRKGSSTLVETSVGGDVTDEDRPTTADFLDEADEVESSRAPLDSSMCDEESLSDDAVISDEEADGGECSVLDTDDNEDVSQLMTDVDPSESRMGMTCSDSTSSSSSSSSSSCTGVGAIALPPNPGYVCTSDDDLFAAGGAILRSAGVGVDTEDTSEGILSDDESSLGAEHESGPDSLPGVRMSSYQRQPLPLDESFCSLGDDNLEEEALTEGCRGKTGIVGGAVWDQLMGGMSGTALDLHTEGSEKNVRENGVQKIVSSVSYVHKQNDGPIFNESLVKSMSVNHLVSAAPLVAEKPKQSNTNLEEGVRVNADKIKSVSNEVPERIIGSGSTIGGVASGSCIAGSQKHKRDSSDGLMTQSAHSALSETTSSDKGALVGAPMSRTLSMSSCGSRFDGRSDGKLSAILDAKLECKLDSTSESVVAALDDAAREAQLQLLNLHAQLQHYRKMALRRKARKVLDAKLNPALKSSILSLRIALTLPQSLPVAIYPLKHSDVPVADCPDCVVQQQWEDSAGEVTNSLSSITFAPSEATQNVLSSAIFRRPGERLHKTFMMREGHVAGLASTVRVVLSSHALYVLTTCPAPSLLHALPYTQVHTLVLGAYREWVVVLSRAAVEWGSSEDKTSVGGTHVVGIQLCAADPVLTLDFMASFELQTRRALMIVHATEMKFANEGKFVPLNGLDERCREGDKTALLSQDHRRPSGDVHTDPQGRTYDSRSGGSKASTPQEWWRPPQWRHGHGTNKMEDFLTVSGRIQRQVPAVVDARQWESLVLSRWLQLLLPAEADTRLVGSWLVDWDGGARLGQQGALGPTMEGSLMFRTTKLFSQWRNAHFLLKAGVLYQFWCSGDRLPHTMLDVTSCTACTPTTQHNKPHAFQVIQSDGSPLLLAAPDADQATRWTNALCAVLSTAAGRPSSRRPLPCRLLLLPGSLVLLHQSDLLISLPRGTPPTPYPTPSAPTAQLPPVPVATDDRGRRDSRGSGAPLPPSIGTLRHSRHLSSSLSSLNSNSSNAVGHVKNASGKVNNPLSPPGAGPTATGGGSCAGLTNVAAGVHPNASTPNPPKSLALSTPLVGDGCTRVGETLVRCAPKLPLNRGAEVRLVARLDLRSLASIGRYNECSNTTILEVQSAFSSAWRSEAVGVKCPLQEPGSPVVGDWALYFRGSRQLENFLTLLASQVVVCEQEVSDASVQQYLLEGAQAAAGAWGAVPSYCSTSS